MPEVGRRKWELSPEQPPVPPGQQWEIYANETVPGLPPDGRPVKLESNSSLILKLKFNRHFGK